MTTTASFFWGFAGGITAVLVIVLFSIVAITARQREVGHE